MFNVFILLYFILGKPVLVVHGGPGGGTDPLVRTLHNTIEFLSKIIPKNNSYFFTQFNPVFLFRQSIPPHHKKPFTHSHTHTHSYTHTHTQMARYFDPKVYKIILVDQRGCGESSQTADISENNTQELVRDFEKIRKELGNF